MRIRRFDPKKAATTITPWDIGEWLLGQCATVKEAREKLQGLSLVAEFDKALGTVPTAHFLVVDATGDSLVVEPIGGKLVMRDAPVGVFMNSPPFTWHLTNLSTYLGLSTQQAKAIKVGTFPVKPLGNSAGRLGLPGNITPPARFVRAALYVNVLSPFKTTEETLGALIRLHQAFYHQGHGQADRRRLRADRNHQWEMYTDLARHKLHFATSDNLHLRVVDAATLDYSPGPIRSLSLDQPQTFEDLTKAFH